MVHHKSAQLVQLRWACTQPLLRGAVAIHTAASRAMQGLPATHPLTTQALPARQPSKRRPSPPQNMRPTEINTPPNSKHSLRAGGMGAHLPPRPRASSPPGEAAAALARLPGSAVPPSSMARLRPGKQVQCNARNAVRVSSCCGMGRHGAACAARAHAHRACRRGCPSARAPGAHARITSATPSAGWGRYLLRHRSCCHLQAGPHSRQAEEGHRQVGAQTPG